MANGQLKVIRHCPPPQPAAATVAKTPAAKAVESVRVSTLIAALKEIEHWSAEIRGVLSNLPPQTSIPMKKVQAAKAKRKVAKKKSK